MVRRPPRSTLDRSSAASDVYKRQVYKFELVQPLVAFREQIEQGKPFQTPSGKIEIFSTTLAKVTDWTKTQWGYALSLIHISEPTRPY